MIALNKIVALLLLYKYALLFPIAVFEGPIITVIAGFLVAQGVLNLYLVFLVVVVGDAVGDTLYYAIGRYGGRPFVLRWGRFLGLDEAKIQKNQTHFENHAGKTLFFGKSQPYGSFILTAAGLAKMPYGKFIWYNVIGTIIKSVILIAVGYYFGEAYASIDKYINYLGVILTAVLAVVIIFFWLKRKYEKNRNRH